MVAQVPHRPEWSAPDRTSRGADHLFKLVAVEAFATEADQQYRADIRMGAKPLHHALGIVVGKAARKADVMRGLGLGGGDLAGDVMGTFDQIGDRDDVADALCGRPGVASRASCLPRCWRVPAKRVGGGIVAFQVVGVDMIARRDRLRG